MTDPWLILQRIASGQMPSENPRSRYGFAHMSRAKMMAMAREACADAGLAFSPKTAWRGVERKAPAKLRLVARLPLADGKIPRRLYHPRTKAA